MKTVLAFGTFDLFHPGHEFFLRTASTYGDRLIVIVARDTNVERIKKRTPIDTEDVRQKKVAAFLSTLGIQEHEARLGYEEWGKHLQVLTDVAPDVICLGYDQHARIPEGAWSVVTLDAYKPEIYKSSLLRTTVEEHEDTSVKKAADV